MKKIILIGLLFLGLIGGVWATRTKVEQVEQVDQVQLTVDFGDGKIATKSAVISEGLNAYQLLRESEFELKTKQYDFGVFVESISEYESTADKVWIYFVNGQAGSVAADKYLVKPGDKVEWKYEKVNTF